MTALMLVALGGAICAMLMAIYNQRQLNQLAGAADSARCLSNLRRQMRAIMKDYAPHLEELWENDEGDTVLLHHLDRIAKDEKRMREAGGWKLLCGPIGQWQARKELGIEE